MALPSVPQEKEQGAVQAEEALAAVAPPPLEPTPAEADEASLAQVVSSAAPIPAQGNVPNQGTPAPNMWRIPTNYQGVLGAEHKPVMQRQEDIGYMWQALASNPNAHPIVRQIAESLLGGGQKR